MAQALVNRGISKGLLGDTQGAIADYTAVVELPGAPPEHVAKALVNRGIAYGSAENHQKALEDCEAALAVTDISVALRVFIMLNRGVALSNLRRGPEAIANFQQCLESRDADQFLEAFVHLSRALVREGRPEEAAKSMAGLHRTEPAGTPTDKRVAARLAAIVDAGTAGSLDTASDLLDAAMTNDPEEVRSLLAFLKPALEFAKSGNERDLAGLPDRERDAARQIASSLTESQRKDGGAHETKAPRAPQTR